MSYGEVRQREPRLELPAFLAAVRSLEECTVRVAGCIDRNIQAAHDNSERLGKGKGLKAHDCFSFAACPPCHDYLDRLRDPERWEIMARARDRTLYLLFREKKLKAAP
jgi:hypothetical protein